MKQAIHGYLRLLRLNPADSRVPFGIQVLVGFISFPIRLMIAMMVLVAASPVVFLLFKI